MADQKSVVSFREESRDKLAYWLADRIDQLAFLTLAGIDYSKRNAGGVRVGSDLPYLEFAQDVTAPSAKRYARWDGASNKVLSWGTGSSSVAAADTPTWGMLSRPRPTPRITTSVVSRARVAKRCITPSCRRPPCRS